MCIISSGKIYVCGIENIIYKGLINQLDMYVSIFVKFNNYYLKLVYGEKFYTILNPF